MFDFYQKRKLRTIINSPFTQVFVIVIALWMGWSAYVRYEIATEISARRVSAEQQVAALEARKQALLEKVQYLSNERGIEAEMRRQFDVALDGEQVVVILDKESPESEIQPLSSSTNNHEDKKWYKFWD